jgi:hypothetical protein
VNDKIQKVKTKLLELGYIDNEWLVKYLEMLEANLNTQMDRKSTQAHHAIPVNSYWTYDEPYDRKEALKLSRRDFDNFEVNLLFKDHLLIHSYLTMCTDLMRSQQRYESQAELRRQNSEKAKEKRMAASNKASHDRTGSKNRPRRNNNNKNAVQLYCVELDRTFASVGEAARELSISKNCIFSCISGRTKTAGKYHWQRA